MRRAGRSIRGAEAGRQGSVVFFLPGPEQYGRGRGAGKGVCACVCERGGSVAG